MKGQYISIASSDAVTRYHLTLVSRSGPPTEVPPCGKINRVQIAVGRHEDGAGFTSLYCWLYFILYYDLLRLNRTHQGILA